MLGILLFKKSKLNHLRILAKRLEEFAGTLLDRIESKLNYINFYPIAPFGLITPPNSPEAQQETDQ